MRREDLKQVAPPMGLRPKSFHIRERLNEIRGAIKRYIDAEICIPIEWIEEYNELTDSFIK